MGFTYILEWSSLTQHGTKIQMPGCYSYPLFITGSPFDQWEFQKAKWALQMLKWSQFASDYLAYIMLNWMIDRLDYRYRYSDGNCYYYYDGNGCCYYYMATTTDQSLDIYYFQRDSEGIDARIERKDRDGRPPLPRHSFCRGGMLSFGFGCIRSSDDNDYGGSAFLAMSTGLWWSVCFLVADSLGFTGKYGRTESQSSVIRKAPLLYEPSPKSRQKQGQRDRNKDEGKKE